MRLIFTTLWFTHQAHQQLMEHAALASDGLETGGLLFGYGQPSVNYVVVMTVTGPGPESVRTKVNFDIGEATCRALRSQHERGYIMEVGMWHTHPVAVPRPSPVDDAGSVWYNEQIGWRHPDVMVIVGVPPGGSPQQVGAWFYTREGRHDLEIRVAEESWRPPIDDAGNWTGTDDVDGRRFT